jgi:hypothetical protein
MTKDIIAKLRAELEAGITTEVQAVYLLAGIRKLIERDEAEDDYPALKFHCDWALHARLDRRSARVMLKLFDDAHVDLRNNVGLGDLPVDVRRGIDRIAKMKGFEAELGKFFDESSCSGRGRCAEPCSNMWPITTRSAITRASRTGSCSHCRIEGQAGTTELCVARNDWVVC